MTVNAERTDTGPLGEISRLARASEFRRQALDRRVRRAGMQATRWMSAVSAEFLKMLFASVAGFWILTELVAYLSPAEPLYTLPALGLLFSAQATLYKVRLQRDPGFVIPGCGCGGSRSDDTAAVLRSRQSAILGIPSSVLAILLYAALLAAVFAGSRDAALALAVSAAVASAYFGYVMVVRLGRLCATCVNIAALNVLILVQLVL